MLPCSAAVVGDDVTPGKQDSCSLAKQNRCVCRRRVWKSLNRRIMRLVFDLIDTRIYKILI